MTYKSKISKNVTIDINNPEEVGYCDRSGERFYKKNLVKQMEWQGGKLVWTGLWVGDKYLDEPQEQKRVLPVQKDPKPVKDPKPHPGTREALPVNTVKAQLNNFHWN